jgi:hypothetical protein
MQKSCLGAINELRVTVDLMNKGYEVFRPIDPCASCDLIALKDGRMSRFQVRSSSRAWDGRIYRAVSKTDTGRQDYYAFVVTDAILYEPTLDVTSEAAYIGLDGEQLPRAGHIRWHINRGIKKRGCYFCERETGL